jgi:hypothetical protein
VALSFEQPGNDLAIDFASDLGLVYSLVDFFGFQGGFFYLFSDELGYCFRDKFGLVELFGQNGGVFEEF